MEAHSTGIAFLPRVQCYTFAFYLHCYTLIAARSRYTFNATRSLLCYALVATVARSCYTFIEPQGAVTDEARASKT